MNRGIPYKSIRARIQVGDAFTCDNRKGGFVSWLIGFFSGDRTHASIVGEATDDNDEGRVEVAESVGNKSVDENYLSEAYADAHGDIYWHPLNCTQEQQAGVKKEIKRQRMMKKKYDIKTLILAITGHISLDAAKFICSEFVWWVLVWVKKFEHHTHKGKKIAPSPTLLEKWIGVKGILVDMTKR
jgi:hypothetical protein